MIHKVQKRKRRKNGRVIESSDYQLRYRIGNMPVAKWRPLGVTDKAVAHTNAAQFIRELERELAGLVPPKKEVEASAAPLSKLISEYESELLTRGRDEKYVTSTAKRIGCIAADCSWRTLRDITADSFMVWRRRQSLKSKTLNDALSDIRSFLQWLVGLGRLASNALSNVPRIKVKDDEEEKRRAFTVAEVERLFQVSGPRSIIYQTTLYCGLRRSEVAQLSWGDVQVDRDGRTFLKIRASTTKSGLTTLQPVPDWLGEKLRAYRPSGSSLADRVFPVISRMPRFLKDLDAAGIPRVDERGHVSKFHSLRHTLGTWLWSTGADPRLIMKLMRHSSLELTVKRYTDEAGLASNDAVKRLPSFGIASASLTQIRAQISDKSGRNVSRVDDFNDSLESSKAVDFEAFSRALSQGDKRGQMVRAAGFEPATPSV